MGEEVNWTVWAWASQEDNRGVGRITVSLHDNQSEALNPAIITGSYPNEEFLDTEYGLTEGFTSPNGGQAFVDPHRLRNVKVSQSSKILDIGNGGEEHIFAKGSYTVTKAGPHDLNIFLNGSYYWPDETGGLVRFDPGENYPAYITAITDPNIDGEGVVNFKDFALMAGNWGRTDCDAGNDWCDCTDLDNDGNVGFFEVRMIALYWLE